MSQPLVLAIEPDLRQAAIVKRIVREQALADVAVVDSRDAAIEMMRTTMPDVLLLSALMSPRDEDELITHLRTLDNAGHLQTHTIPQLASALGPAERGMARGLFSAFRRKKDQEPAVVAGCDPDLFAEEIRVYLQRAADRKRELANSGPSAAVRAAKSAAQPKTAPTASKDEGDTNAASSSWESPFEWKPTTSRRAPVAPPEPPPAPEPSFSSLDMEPAPEPMFAETAQPEPEPAFAEPEPAFVEPLVEEPLHAQPAVDDLPLIVRPAAEEPSVVLQTPIIPEPGTVAEPLILSEPMFPPEPSIDAPHKVAAAAPVDPWVVHTPQFVSIDPVIETRRPVVVEPTFDVDPVIEVVSDAPAFEEPLYTASVTDRHEAVSIDLDALPEEPEPAPVSAVHERAVKIVARVQDEHTDDSEWTRPQPVRVTDRLGPLARWARSEPKKQKPAAVTADDVRALIASLAVPPAVAYVSYPHGCRIRRVRVPAAVDTESAEATGPVILSRRALAEQRAAQGQ